jgi:geranylgeranyl pyrophosphate synthase
LEDPHHGAAVKKLLSETGPGYVERVREVLLASGAIDYCRARAQEHLGNAAAALDLLRPGPERDELKRVAEFIGARDY